MNTQRRKEAYEALHPETKHGANQHTRSSQFENSRSFADDTADKTGVSRQTIARDAARGSKISEDVLTEIRGTELAVQRAMNTQRRKEPLTDGQLKLLQTYQSLTPRAQGVFIPFLKAVIAKRGVQKAALALLRANGDPDAHAKAVEAVDRLGAVS